MATELQEEQLAEAAQEPLDGQPSQPEQAEQTPPKEPKKKRELLVPLLSILLILIGIGEAAFWGYFGFSSYRSSLANERYEAQQKALEEERAAKGIVGGSAYGPNWKIENGTVTWEREKKVSAGADLTGDADPVPRREDGLRLSRISVVNIPYTLAEMDEEDVLPPQQTSNLTGDGTAPAST